MINTKVELTKKNMGIGTRVMLAHNLIGWTYDNSYEFSLHVTLTNDYANSPDSDLYITFTDYLGLEV